MTTSLRARWTAFPVLAAVLGSASLAYPDRYFDDCDHGHDHGRDCDHDHGGDHGHGHDCDHDHDHDHDGGAGVGDWTMYNHDARGTRNNVFERRLAASNVASLHTHWSVATPAPVSGTPAVTDGHVYAGDGSGTLYSLDESSGRIEWRQHLAGAITASVAVVGDRLVIGTLRGYVYGVDRFTGRIDWSVNPGLADGDEYPAIYGSATRIGRFVALGIASDEEQHAPDAACTGCRDRGRVVLIDAESGHVAWSTPTVTDDERNAGAAGAAVWSSPAYAEEQGLVYVTTGNNYTATTSAMEDAFVALDVHTGAIRWTNQRTANDTWNWHYPSNDPAHPGSDFADSPQVYTLASGQLVVGAGEKNGFYFVVDAATGSLVQQTQLQPGGPLGGLFSDSAYADGVVYANGSDFPDGWVPGDPPHAGYLTAVSADATTVYWQFQIPDSADLSGVAVANGVVYFASLQASELFALDTQGNELAHFALPNGVASGPAVAHGSVFIGTGDPLSGTPGPGSIVALGL